MELDFISYFDIPEMLGRGDASAVGWLPTSRLIIAASRCGQNKRKKKFGATTLKFSSPRASRIHKAAAAGSMAASSSPVNGAFPLALICPEWEQLACIVKDKDGKAVDLGDVPSAPPRLYRHR